MGYASQAILFYGYVELPDVFYEDENPWEAARNSPPDGFICDFYGLDRHLGHYLAVEDSHHVATWTDIITLKPEDLAAKPEWNEQLKQAAEHLGIDLTGLTPSWHLVSLYF